MWFKETREHLGNYLKRYLQKYVPENDGQATRAESESTLLFFLQKGLYPIMAIAVITFTITDFILFSKYRHTSYKKFLSLFPIPVMAVVFFLVNAFLTLITSIVLVCQKMLGCNCECFLVTSTLLLLFGIVYLLYHGFWMIIALLAYPGRILIGSIFVIPSILVIVPTWNILIKAIKNFYRGWKDDDDDSNIQGIGWCFFLILDLTIWGLFIAILYYMSKFLLSSVNLENKTFQSILSFVTVSAISIILIWFNTDFIAYQRDSQGNQQTQGDQETQDDQEDELNNYDD